MWIVIYIVKRIHAEDVTRPTHLPVPFGGPQSMPHGMCGSGGELPCLFADEAGIA